MIAQIHNKIQNFLEKRGVINGSLYTNQKHIIAELERRQAVITNDAELLEIIKPTPSIQHLLEKPHLVLIRQVATPLHETLRIIELAKEIGLPLSIIEFTADKFVSTHNKFKHDLGKLPIFDFTEDGGRDVFHSHTVTDFNSYTGHPIREVMTTRGESLVELHHQLFTDVTGIEVSQVVSEASDWFAQFNNSASEYYEAMLTLFVKHNILAEMFLTKKDYEIKFTRNIVESSSLRVSKKHGFKPLILNHQPTNEQDRLYWDCYPAVVDDLLQQRGYIV